MPAYPITTTTEHWSDGGEEKKVEWRPNDQPRSDDPADTRRRVTENWLLLPPQLLLYRPPSASSSVCGREEVEGRLLGRKAQSALTVCQLFSCIRSVVPSTSFISAHLHFGTVVVAANLIRALRVGVLRHTEFC